MYSGSTATSRPFHHTSLARSNEQIAKADGEWYCMAHSIFNAVQCRQKIGRHDHAHLPANFDVPRYDYDLGTISDRFHKREDAKNEQSD